LEGVIMKRYRQSEIEDILKLFEKELATLNRLTRIEKMKIRKRVANSVIPALSASKSEPDAFLNIIETKLRDVFNMFIDGWGFRQNLRQQVGKINKRQKALKKELRKDLEKRQAKV
jgi:hypothetical protein